MKKHTYEQPLAETFELSIQNTILDGSPYGSEGAAGGNVTSGGVYNFDDLED